MPKGLRERELSFFWDVTQRGFLVSYRRVGTFYRSHRTGTLFRIVGNYQSTLWNIPEERRFHLHRGRSLKSHLTTIFHYGLCGNKSIRLPCVTRCKGPVFLELVMCFNISRGLRYRQKLSIYCNVVISYARHLVVIVICFPMLVPYGLLQSLGTVSKPATVHKFVERNCECG